MLMKTIDRIIKTEQLKTVKHHKKWTQNSTAAT